MFPNCDNLCAWTECPGPSYSKGASTPSTDPSSRGTGYNPAWIYARCFRGDNRSRDSFERYSNEQYFGGTTDAHRHATGEYTGGPNLARIANG